MASREYFNNLVTINDVFYDSHKTLIEKICIELETTDKVDYLMNQAEMKKIFTVDLKNQIVFSNQENLIRFEVDQFRKKCLLEGLDDIGLTLKKTEQINQFETDYKKVRPWVIE